MPEVVVAKPRVGKFTKNAARRVRVAGKIPSVLYGAGHEAVAIEVDPKQISRILFSETGHNTIFDVEDGVVAGLGEKNPGNLLGVHLDGYRIVPRTVQYGRNLARDAHTASGILVELALPGLGYDNFWHSVSRFLDSGTGRSGSAPFVKPVVSGQRTVDRKTTHRSRRPETS